MVGDDPNANGVKFLPGETSSSARSSTRSGFTPEPGDGKMKLVANLTAEQGSRTVPLRRRSKSRWAAALR